MAAPSRDRHRRPFRRQHRRRHLRLHPRQPDRPSPRLRPQRHRQQRHLPRRRLLNKGSANTYVGETLVPGPATVTDTWGTYTVFSGIRIAADLNALGGANADPGTRVSPGATLTIGPGLAFQGEPLAFGGTLGSPGAVANTTRFASSGTAAIALTGDSTITVTEAAGQFLIGPVSGSGSLLKTGPGNLVMEGAANTFSGSLTISAGVVTARANKARNDLFVAAGTSFRGLASLSVNQPATAHTVLDGTLVVNSRGAADTNAHTVNLGRLTGSGLITTTTTGSVLGTVFVVGESAFDGVIEGKLGLTKTGTATTLVLTGAHTYSGATQISAGVLNVSGQLPTTTALTLASNATLARDISLGALQVGTFTASDDSLLRPTGAPADFDPRRAYAWPFLAATSITGSAPTLDASALPATTGAYALAASATALTVTHMPARYAAWQFEQAIPYASPSTADANTNGLPDLLDYALAPDPFTSASNPNVRITNIGGTLALTFFRARNELTYEVLGTSDLAEWTSISIDPGVVGKLVTVADNEPATARRFLRLKVTR